MRWWFKIKLLSTGTRKGIKKVRKPFSQMKIGCFKGLSHEIKWSFDDSTVMMRTF
jgi:hypothetical protein